MAKIKFLKVTDVKTPERDVGNGGIDFFIPNDIEYLKGYRNGVEMPSDPVVVKDEHGKVVEDAWRDGKIVIPPRGSVLIPLGVRYLTSNKWKHIYVCNKSGVATKKGLEIGACLCDHSYENVAHGHLISTRAEEIELEPGDKVVQGMIIKSYPDKVVSFEAGEISGKKFFKRHMKNRGLAGFGSTGTK